MDSQDAAWQGFVEYFHGDNNILLRDGDGLTLIEDTWGTRCDHPFIAGDCGGRYSECDKNCVPDMLQLALDNGTVVDVDIYEPCNFVSNLAFYRVMPQLCDPHVHMDPDTSKALVYAFASVGFGSAFWHGSHTYAGNRADNIPISIIAFLNHQLIIKGLAKANEGRTIPGLPKLMDLSEEPRKKTAFDMSMDFTNILANSPVVEWAQDIIDLGSPPYELTFSVITASVFTSIFPDRQDTVEAILSGLAEIFGADSNTLNTEYLPMLQSLANNLNLSESEKFVLFRQLVGVGGKLIFAFFWQEQVFDFNFFLEPGTNQIGQEIMGPLFAVFNFISGYQHNDKNFQAFVKTYPGAESCQPTEPHAKWHECAANGLLDMSYLADCVAAVATGTHDSGCAQLENLNGMNEITLSSFQEMVEQEIEMPNIFVVKYVLPFFFTKIFDLFDTNDDNKIDWSDIETYFDTIEDAYSLVGSFVDGFQDLMELFDNIDCITDDQCTGDDKCVFFSCGLQDNGDICVSSSDCKSGRCEWDSFTCQSKLTVNAECNEDDDCGSNVCTGGLGFIKGTCGKQSIGGTCLESSDCESGRCEGIIFPWKCEPKLNDGKECNESSDCISNECILGRCGLKDDGDFCILASDCESNICILASCGLKNNGEFCALDSDCKSGSCDFIGLSRECTNKENNGGTCNEDSDCKSGRCEGFWPPWRCEAKLENGSRCNEDSDCVSDNCGCSGWFCTQRCR